MKIIISSLFKISAKEIQEMKLQIIIIINK